MTQSTWSLGRVSLIAFARAIWFEADRVGCLSSSPYRRALRSWAWHGWFVWLVGRENYLDVAEGRWEKKKLQTDEDGRLRERPGAPVLRGRLARRFKEAICRRQLGVRGNGRGSKISLR